MFLVGSVSACTFAFAYLVELIFGRRPRRSRDHDPSIMGHDQSSVHSDRSAV